MKRERKQGIESRQRALRLINNKNGGRHIKKYRIIDGSKESSQEEESKSKKLTQVFYRPEEDEIRSRYRGVIWPSLKEFRHELLAELN